MQRSRAPIDQPRRPGKFRLGYISYRLKSFNGSRWAIGWLRNNSPDIETTVVEREAGISRDLAASLVKLGGKVRNLKNHGLEEGVSTRLLIYAGTLIRQGVATDRACDVAIARPITDDPDMQRSIVELAKAIF